MKIIKLPCYGIVVEIADNGSGSIISGLHDNNGHEEEDFQIFESAINTVESIILAHALAGVNIKSKEYIGGIAVTIDAIIDSI